MFQFGCFAGKIDGLVIVLLLLCLQSGSIDKTGLKMDEKLKNGEQKSEKNMKRKESEREKGKNQLLGAIKYFDP